MVTWGIISGAMAFVQGPISFYVMPFGTPGATNLLRIAQVD